MSIATVLWILAVAGLVTGVAAALSAALRRMHRPERWVWLVALAVTAALPFLPAPEPVVEARNDAVATATRVIPIAQFVTVASSSLPEPARVSIPWIPILWGSASVATVLAMLGGAWSLARRRERWPRRRIDGDLLRVSDRFGPAVVGWIDPEIVLPEWAVDMERRQRRLILRHENEHRWARDPQLLALGVLCLAAAPWNPFAWLQFRGLRRAVEFDCDARVLGSGASPRAYGRLLLSVQLDGGRGALFAPALREPASFLQRRLETMKLRDRPVARVRVAGLALVAAALTVVACETPRPTESEPAVTSPVQAQVAATSDSYRARIEQLTRQYRELDVDVRWRLDGEDVPEPGPRFEFDRIERMMSVFVNETEDESLGMIVDLFTESAEQIQVIEIPPDESAIAEAGTRVDGGGVDGGRDDASIRDGQGVGEPFVWLEVDPRGAVTLRRSGESGRQTVLTSEVGPVWEEVARSSPDLMAIVRADPDTPAHIVDEVLSGLRNAGAERIAMLGDSDRYTEVSVPSVGPDSTRSGPVPGLRSDSARSVPGLRRAPSGPVPGLRPGATRDSGNSIELWRPDARDSLRLHGDSLGSAMPSGIRPIGDTWGISPNEDGKPPLVYVDGVRIAPDAHDGLPDLIRPQDIERIEVIKGPAATTLYGERAEGGVVLIFTKGGG